MNPEHTEDFTSQPQHIDMRTSQILQEEFVFTAGKVKVFEQSPLTEVQDSTSILYVPGWMGTLIRAEETMGSIVSHDRKAVTLQFMRENGRVESDGKNRKIELQKAEMIRGVIDKKSLGRVDVIAHSEAGINTLIAACAAPENFRNIVLMNPAGLIGKDNPVSFLWRFMKSGKDSRKKIQDVLDQKDREGGRYSHVEASRILERDEAVRSATSADIRINKKMFASEIGALADSDIFEMLEYLKEHDVQVAIVAGYDDKLFPLKRMVQQIEKRYGSMGGAPVHDFYTIVGTHADIYSDAKFPGFLGIVTDQTNTEVNVDVAMEALRRMESARSSTR